jgi:predicted ferric reductase
MLRSSSDPTERPPHSGLRRFAPALPVGLLVALYAAVLVAPLALAWAQDLPPRHWRDELSSALAMVAFTGVLAEFLLSGRFRTISGRIGIDATMRVHQLMARSFCVFLLVHPFIYASALTGTLRPWDTTGQYTLGLSLPTLATGLAAWIILFVMVAFAIFREQRSGSYEGWRAAHGFAAVLVVGFGAHHTLEAGRYSAHPGLFWFWVALLALAAFTLIWVYIIKPLSQIRHPYAVRAVRPAALKTWELDIAPMKGEAIPFDAGQFVWLNVGNSPFSLGENPFSIASGPSQRDRLSFIIKEMGDFTGQIGEVKPGTPCYIDGPHGHLSIAGSRAPGICLIAGGVGIAPILSIARELHATRDPRPVVLLYGNRVKEQIVGEDELRAMQADIDLDVEFVLAEPPPGWDGRTGVIDKSLLRSVAERPDGAAWLYAICGPQAMIEAVEKTLMSLGVPGRNVISEQFYYD